MQSRKFGSQSEHTRTVVVAVDISKDTFTAYFRCLLTGKQRSVRSYPYHRKGVEQLYDEAQKFAAENGSMHMILGLESTGVYHLGMVEFFKDKPVEIQQVNTLHVKRMKDITDNTPTKTDWKDPRVIADLIELGRGLRMGVAEEVFLELRQLTHARERVIADYTAVGNKLSNLVHILFPEFHRFFTNIHGSTARKMLKMYPLPSQIGQLGENDLYDFLKKESRGRYNREFAEGLFEAAKASLGCVQGAQNYITEIHVLIDLCELMYKAKKSYEDRIYSLITELPLAKVLLSFKGVGPMTTATILGEYTGFEGFETIAEVLKYAGMNLTECSSGKLHGRRRLAKRGRPLIRKILYFAAMNMVRKGNEFHDKYQRYINAGKPKVAALMAIARKILRIMFAMSKSGQSFNKEYAQKYLKAA